MAGLRRTFIFRHLRSLSADGYRERIRLPSPLHHRNGRTHHPAEMDNTNRPSRGCQDIQGCTNRRPEVRRGDIYAGSTAADKEEIQCCRQSVQSRQQSSDNAERRSRLYPCTRHCTQRTGVVRYAERTSEAQQHNGQAGEERIVRNGHKLTLVRNVRYDR